MKKRASTAASILFFVSTLSAMAADDPFVGTWKLNVAQSRFAPGQELKSQLCVIEAREGGVRIVYDSVPVKGRPVHVEQTTKFDGKDYAVTGNPDADTYSLTRIDANTLDGTWKKAGKVVQTARWVVLKDGRHFQGTLKSKAANGMEVTQFAVYEKQ